MTGTDREGQRDQWRRTGVEGNGLGHGHTNRQWDIRTGRKGQEEGQEHGQDRDRGTDGQGQDRVRTGTGTGYDRDIGTVTGIVTQAQRNKDRGTATGIVRQGQRNKDRHRDRDRGTVTKDRNMNRVTQTGTEGQG